MEMNLQPILENQLVLLRPLVPADFQILFSVAADPLIWEQHPSRNRYQYDVFTHFFEGAIQSGGAFMIFDKQLSTPIGSTRFYDLNAEEKSIFIGYTFYARKYWGGKFNPSVKKLMLDYAFNYLNKVYFHIGTSNIRSQKSIEKLGAQKIGEMNIVCHGETDTANFLYEITRQQWMTRQIIPES